MLFVVGAPAVGAILDPNNVATLGWTNLNHAGSVSEAGYFQDGDGFQAGDLTFIGSATAPSGDNKVASFDSALNGNSKIKWRHSGLPGSGGMAAYMVFNPSSTLNFLGGNYTIMEFRGGGHRIRVSARDNANGTITFRFDDAGSGTDFDVTMTTYESDAEAQGWMQLYLTGQGATFRVYDLTKKTVTLLGSMTNAGANTGTDFTVGNDSATAGRNSLMLVDEVYYLTGTPFTAQELVDATPEPVTVGLLLLGLPALLSPRSRRRT